MSHHRNLAVAAAIIASACLVTSSPAQGAAAHRSDAPVMWHAQQAMLGNTGQVAGASASLVRNDRGISYQLHAASLEPGNAYTLWLVVIDHPEACSATPCAAGEIIGSAAVDGQVRFAAGQVAGGSGSGTFAGAVREGPLDGWNADRVFDDASGAEIHLVVNDHGPAIAEQMPGMIHTYRGGCADSSPFPPVFPPAALADGEPGPNTCRLFQAAVFTAP